MTDAQLEATLDKATRLDRKITHRVLVLINQAEDRKLYAKRGFSTMKRWLVKRFLYSDTAAYQRLTAASLLREVPEVAQKIVSGEVNLSTLNTAQKIIREQENLAGKALDSDTKTQVVNEIQNRSAWEAEEALLKMFPDVKLEPKHETRKNVDKDSIRVSNNFSRELMAEIEELRKQNGINGGFKEVVQFLVKGARKKPKVASPTCVFEDPETGHVCGADNWLEEDHIIPVALGGSDAPSNKRWLCRTHNQLEAQRILGPLADHRGESTRRLQLKAANRVNEVRLEALSWIMLH